jgi:hypothetical protein
MLAEIEGFDETDFKTLLCHISGKTMATYEPAELKGIIPAFIARIGVITGIEIPANHKVFQLLENEITTTLTKEKIYGKLTYQDLINAITMAANNDFGKVDDWGKSLNLKFLRTILNRYCNYKSSLLLKYSDWQGLETERMNSTIGKTGKFKIDYRPITEQAYQEYLSGKYNQYLWHWQCYQDLVDAGWMPEHSYTDFIRQAKQVLIGQLNSEIIMNEKSRVKINGSIYASKDNLPISLGKNMESIMKLTAIKNGESQELIEHTAKQLCMVEYFKQQAVAGVKNLFIREQANDTKNA